MEKLFWSLSHQTILDNRLDGTIARELTFRSWELAGLLLVHCVMRSISYWAQGLFLGPNYLIPVPDRTKVSRMRCKSMRMRNVDQGCISCGILLSGTGARGISSEHMENMEMFSCSPT